MQRPDKRFLVMMIFLLSLCGCVKQNKQSLKSGDKVSPVVIADGHFRKTLPKNSPYIVKLVTDRPIRGCVSLDLDHDGKMEKLEYLTVVTVKAKGEPFISECRLRIGRAEITQRSEKGIGSLGIVDSSQRRGGVEFYLVEGKAGNEKRTIYRYEGQRIERVAE